MMRRLVVNADDFGRSAAVNAAVVCAHREGILTTASLMVNEPGAAEAVALAREHPRLGVGLHLTLLDGRAALPPEQLHGLVNAQGEFDRAPVRVGWRYFFRRELREPLRKEVRAQFAKFRETGLTLDHVNGHLHLHLHPVVLPTVIEEMQRLGARHARLTRDPFWLEAWLAGGRWLYRAAHAVVFLWLARAAERRFYRQGLRHTDRVFGLLQNGRVDEAYVLRLLERLPPGDSELYAHPALGEFEHELAALISPRVRARVTQNGIRLVRYQDM
ncbi:MAG: hopanoid biosynthesis-associated protein HpnK [Verrucomicrobiales bacterium]|nr:hopanoid biosynthesis-associated protein HpnK [Verrucomicrobiales bacterium]